MKTTASDPVAALAPLQFRVLDHFVGFADGALWTKTAADAGSSVALDADGVGGIITLTTGGTDNNEAYLATAELFKFQAGKALEFTALVQFSEANTDDANVIVGLLDAPGANTLVDNGAGPKASYSGVVFFKVDGGTTWQVEVSNGSTQSTYDTGITAGGSAKQKLQAVGVAGPTSVQFSYFIDNVPVMDSTGLQRLTHTVAIASATEMAACFGIKAGGSNSEVLNVDLADFVQVS